MYNGGIFVFGTEIFRKDTTKHVIFSLPLEITWKIFSYLDDRSLRTVAHTHKMWARIIIAKKQLRNRLNKFDLAIKFGSASLAKFYRKNKRKLLKERRKNYLPIGKTKELSTERALLKMKRGAGDLEVYTKRFKLFEK